MTFIPNVQSISDNNNSTTSTVNPYLGVWTLTNGYEGICLNIVCDENSSANGVKIDFSYDGSTVSKTISDTFFKNINFSKTYQIIDKYYRISFTTSAPPTLQNITTRLVISTSTDIKQNDFYNSNNSIFDAFGKLRVSNPFTLLDVKFPIQPPGGAPAADSEYLNNDQFVCTDTSSITDYLQTTNGNGYRTIYVNNKSAGFFKSQSRKYCVYLPGKSTLVLCSGIINAGVAAGFSSNTGVTTNIGLFDDYNGFYFSFDSANMYVSYKNNGIVTTTVQSQWNIDPMNGSGTSSLNLDFTKTQLFVIDFEWLGVGRIRYGFYAFGKINYCHQIININSLSAPYFQSANLPIRYELLGINGSGNIGALIQICSTVISEGGYNPQGRPFTINNGLPTSNNITTAETCLLSIKGGSSNYYHQNIIPTSIDIINTANTTAAILYRIRLFLSPAADPGTFSWLNVNNYSVVQYAIGGTGVTFTNSIIVDEGYFTGKGGSQFNSLSDIFSNFIQITSNIDGISDILMITAQIETGNAQISCGIKWQEIY